MCRDEVLEYVQAFTEVCSDWCLNDGAVWFGHQASHPGELSNLRSGTTRTRVSHHVNGVERLLPDLVTVTVNDRLGCQLLHHGLANFIASLAPNIDHVVVTLLRGHQARRVLLVDLFDFATRFSEDVGLAFRNKHVAHGNRNAAAGCKTETRLHQLVSKDHRVAQTATTERLVNQA